MTNFLSPLNLLSIVGSFQNFVYLLFNFCRYTPYQILTIALDSVAPSSSDILSYLHSKLGVELITFLDSASLFTFAFGGLGITLICFQIARYVYHTFIKL